MTYAKKVQWKKHIYKFKKRAQVSADAKIVCLAKVLREQSEAIARELIVVGQCALISWRDDVALLNPEITGDLTENYKKIAI